MLTKFFQKLNKSWQSNDFFRARLKLTLFYMLVIAIMLAFFNGILGHQLNQNFLHYREDREISQQEASAIAATYSKKAKIVRVKKERVKGVNYYEVNFSDGTEIMIDASSGDGGLENEIIKDPEDTFQDYLEDALLTVNLIIILLAGFLSYFLAGKTLEPIAQKMREQKQFSSNIAHELRDPLAAIHAAAQSALRKKTFPIKASKEVFEAILEDSIRLSSLSEDLLLLVSSESFENNFNKVNVKTIVKKVLKDLEPLSSKKNISFKGTLKDFSRMGDKKMIEALIFNLIHNAIKFSHTKGEIIVSLGVNGELTIQDLGIGIAPQHISSVFDRFYKIDKSDVLGGSGLGLSIVQEVAKRHGADVVVSSNLGKGTLFKILF